MIRTKSRMCQLLTAAFDLVTDQFLRVNNVSSIDTKWTFCVLRETLQDHGTRA